MSWHITETQQEESQEALLNNKASKVEKNLPLAKHFPIGNPIPFSHAESRASLAKAEIASII